MMEQRKPGTRVDGGKRRDLNGARVAERMIGVPKNIPTRQQISARHKQREKRAKAEKKAAKIGHEGATISAVTVKVSGVRKSLQAFRSRPGTFEWQYGRQKQDVLFHAGSHLAILWERAGMTVSSSADFLRGTTSGYSPGISDRRLVAMDRLRRAYPALGRQPFDRLVDYCVKGLTTRQIAAKHGSDTRAMAHVLHQDLRACAVEFEFLRIGKVA